MVRLREIGRDQQELEIGDWIFLFSYGVPVAACDKRGNVKYETESHYSVTTSRHVMKWLERVPGEAKTMLQTELEKLIESKGGQ
jgi:hypothetical protein